MVRLPELWLPILIATALVTLAAAILERLVPARHGGVRARPSSPFPVSLGLFALFALAVSVMAGYLAGRTLDAGTEYLEVFRVAGTAAILGYSMGHLASGIWGARDWGGVLREFLFGLAYGLLTAGSFGGFWPGS